MFRFIVNKLFPSTLIFSDGSRLDYLIRDDCLRYKDGLTRDVTDVPLIYDGARKRSRIDQGAVWQWKSNGRPLDGKERSDLIRKINEFMVKRPREFEIGGRLVI
jgi:hypothetical protein